MFVTLFTFALSLIEYAAAFHSSRGDYKPAWYNASSFFWSDLANINSKCSLTAKYSSGGTLNADADDFAGCDYEEIRYESNPDFDLQFYELLKVCPWLERVPEAQYQDFFDATNTKRNLPTSLIWTTDRWSDAFWCSADADNCPRFHCSNASQPDHQWYTSKQIDTLSFSSTPLVSTCYECECDEFKNGDTDRYWDADRPYAWNCDLSPYWQMNPIDDGGELYDARYCYHQTRNPTSSPTAAPSVNVSLAPTDSPTGFPTGTPTVVTAVPSQDPTMAPTTGCLRSSTLGARTGYAARGTYYWDTIDVVGCSTISFCYCPEDLSEDATCLSEWTDIYDDDILRSQLLNLCGTYIADCWKQEDGDRLFDWYSGSSVCSWVTSGSAINQPSLMCPRCGCGDTAATPEVQSSLTNTTYNTTTYYSVQNTSKPIEDWVYLFSCDKCSCTLAQSGKGEWVSYVEGCVEYDDQNNDEPDDCIYAPRRCTSISDSDYDPMAGWTPCNNQRGSSSEYQSACQFERYRLDDSTR